MINFYHRFRFAYAYAPAGVKNGNIVADHHYIEFFWIICKERFFSGAHLQLDTLPLFFSDMERRNTINNNFI